MHMMSSWEGTISFVQTLIKIKCEDFKESEYIHK